MFSVVAVVNSVRGTVNFQRKSAGAVFIRGSRILSGIRGGLFFK